MKKTAKLIPQEGLIVRDPISKDILSEEGEIKPLIGAEGRYWRRRLRDNSVKMELKIKRIVKREVKKDDDTVQ